MSTDKMRAAVNPPMATGKSALKTEGIVTVKLAAAMVGTVAPVKATEPVSLA